MTTPCEATPGCAGTLDDTGFCDVCGLAPQPPSPPTSITTPTTTSTTTSTTSTTRSTRAGGVSDPFSLPVFSFPDPSSRIIDDPKVPDRDRVCPQCGAPIGRSYKGQPGLTKGACPDCGQSYSFEPSLRKGDLVGGQYRVAGCFARGGLGWVYLANDTRLDDNLVVLKGLIDVGDASVVVAERQALTIIEHPNIVRIFNFVRHPDTETGEDRDYIVMEYVDGLSLRQVCAESTPNHLPLGEPLLAEHVIACGLQILAAFDYLHEKGLLYCDMKPDNVIMRSGQHGGRANRVKLIDLGAVRAIADRTSRVIGTEHYQVSRQEIDTHGLTVRSDLYTVGRTLDELFRVSADARAPDDAVEIGLESFELAIARATGPYEGRFASANEMADQLRGIHRRISALRDRHPHPEPSTLFAQTAALLDGGLGTVPALRCWVDGARPTDRPAALPIGAPAPAVVATSLPVPYPDPEDRYADVVTDIETAQPRVRLGKLAECQSVEAALARCRANLELGDVDEADRDLSDVPDDWRARWHKGMCALARNHVGAARDLFRAVRRVLPGEDAPLLALAYCLELTAEPAAARKYYHAVWQRDHGQASGAFGLARLALAEGDRSDALAKLAHVPAVSRHADAAGIAQVLIRTHPVAGRPPSHTDLESAADKLPTLYLDGGDPDGEARTRLTAVVREAVRHWLRDNDGPLPVFGGESFGNRPDERAIRALLEKSYQAMARQARDADTHGVLLDRANNTRPITFL
jgi:serine/threonine-protein kinase PknG